MFSIKIIKLKNNTEIKIFEESITDIYNNIIYAYLFTPR